MTLGRDAADALAYALVEATFDFDAVERGSLRAEWTDDDAVVSVVDRDTGEAVHYAADDLVLATSDDEVRNARRSDAP